MIHKLVVKGLKNIRHEEFLFEPLTILTGLNSTGKSSILQAILLLNKETTRNGAIYLSNLLSSFDSLRNVYERAQEITIRLEADNRAVDYKLTGEKKEVPDNCAGLELEKNLYYLSANRIGAENSATISQDIYCGVDGNYLLGTYEKEKSNAVSPALVKEQSSLTLAAQLNYWQSYILGLKLELSTERRDEQTVGVKYKSDGIPNLMPSQLGAGVSYLAKILILCLRAVPGDVILVENPEIHLHPAAQSRLSDFFTFVVNAGIQLIIETHCDHLINKLQYEVYKKRLRAGDVVIYYKPGITVPFLSIRIKESGRFSREFPDGFFDVTLAELLEME